MLRGDGAITGSRVWYLLSRMKVVRMETMGPSICISPVPWPPCAERTNLLVSELHLIRESCSDGRLWASLRPHTVQ